MNTFKVSFAVVKKTDGTVAVGKCCCTSKGKRESVGSTKKGER